MHVERYKNIEIEYCDNPVYEPDTDETIIGLFPCLCKKKADIIERADGFIVVCPYCKRESEGNSSSAEEAVKDWLFLYGNDKMP